jgi:hypothetical protein
MKVMLGKCFRRSFSIECVFFSFEKSTHDNIPYNNNNIVALV